MTVRAELEARFRRTVEALPRVERRLALPPALRETMVGAAERGVSGPSLVPYYCERMPSLLVEQLHAARELLARPVAGWSRLRGALVRQFAALESVGLDGETLTGARSADALLAARPTLGALAAATLFGSGLPLLGLDAVAPDDSDDVVD